MQKFSLGESYWRVILSTGRVISELERSFDLVRGKRPINWHLDLVAAGDVARIKELWICTPAGEAALRIDEPYTAYQFSMSSLMTDGSDRSKLAQIIGRVDDKATGKGIAYIWDVATQQLYKDDQADVMNFGAWRPGITPPGALALPALGVRL